MGTLDLWNNGATKKAILDFVNQVTTVGSKNFVPPKERIAVFDNDGTLWCEKPLPIQADFMLRKVAEMAKKDPELTKLQPWKAVTDKDYEWLQNVIVKHYQGDDSDLKQMSKALLEAFQDLTIEEFAKESSLFFKSATHPIFKRLYTECTYLPMQELLHLLEDKGFTIYIVSGGGRDFVRTISENIYNVPPERVIGSSVSLKFQEQDDKAQIIHMPALDIFDDGPAKPVRIWSRVGRRPIFAVGNANGDIPMLKFAKHPRYQSLALYIDHDDKDREFSYNKEASALTLEGQKHSWVKISMKQDWKTIFATQSSSTEKETTTNPNH